jgi:hypothetical protein
LVYIVLSTLAPSHELQAFVLSKLFKAKSVPALNAGF